MTAVLVVKELRKSFMDGEKPRVVLEDVSFEVAKGELVAIMGPSGSGKSTILHLVAGLDRPASGSIEVQGSSVCSMGAAQLAKLRRQNIGYVEQRLNLISSLSAEENVMLPLELDGVRSGEARQAALAALERTGMADRASQTSEHLSGGEQQRVAIARALVGDRGLLLVDEPTAALDSMAAEAVMRLLREQCDAGVSALITTHDATQAAWADRVLQLRDGNVQ